MQGKAGHPHLPVEASSQGSNHAPPLPSTGTQRELAGGHTGEPALDAAVQVSSAEGYVPLGNKPLHCGLAAFTSQAVQAHSERQHGDVRSVHPQVQVVRHWGWPEAATMVRCRQVCSS